MSDVAADSRFVIKGGTIGAVGLSGGHYTQDMECARAGLATIGADAL
jgi:uncharacterized protein GlcG (DUF336 family)